MAARRSGLGRGLEALIPTEPGPDKAAEFRLVPIDLIQTNPDQPRSRFDDSTLAELAASMEEVGVLQPIVLTESESGFVLIAGERRLRAAKRAGLNEIPAVVRETTGESTLVEALIENLQRQDLTPLEEARAFLQLLEDNGMTQEQVAGRVGKSRSAISNTVRLLQLPDPVQQMVEDGDLSAGHARTLVGVEDTAYATHLAEKAVSEGWSVRQMEEAVKARRDLEQGGKPRIKQLRPVEIIELEKRLGKHLGAGVKISYKDQKGKLEIKFGSLMELESIYRAFIE